MRSGEVAGGCDGEMALPDLEDEDPALLLLLLPPSLPNDSVGRRFAGCCGGSGACGGIAAFAFAVPTGEIGDGKTDDAGVFAFDMEVDDRRDGS